MKGLVMMLATVICAFVTTCGGSSTGVPIPPVLEARGPWLFLFVESVEVPSRIIAGQPTEFVFRVIAPEGERTHYPYYYRWVSDSFPLSEVQVIAACVTNDPRVMWVFNSDYAELAGAGEQTIRLAGVVFPYQGDFTLLYYSAKSASLATLVEMMPGGSELAMHPMLQKTELTIHVEPGPVHVDPRLFELTIPTGETTQIEFTLYNDREEPLVWSAAMSPYTSWPVEDSPWISLVDNGGLVPAGGETTIIATVSADTEHFRDWLSSDFKATIRVTTSDPVYGTLDVVVKLHLD